MAEKEKIGLVISDKMKNTRIVTVNDRIIHKRYKKVVTRTKRYAVYVPPNTVMVVPPLGV